MEYIERRNNGLYVAGSRVSLASIIAAFRSGESPETIRDNFSSLSLAQVYGALAYYLNHREECAAYLADLDHEWRALAESGALNWSPVRRTA